MKKVSVSVNLNYYYEVEIDDALVNDKDELLYECGAKDPVFADLVNALVRNHVDWDNVFTNSIIDTETGKTLYIE